MKYIMIKVTVGGCAREIPIIFPNLLTHFDVAAAAIAGCPELNGGAVISAGFVNSPDIDVDCHGKSESLKLSSRTEDSGIIHWHDYKHGLL